MCCRPRAINGSTWRKKSWKSAGLYGFREIRVPTFEHTELFNRSVGDTTDVVQKEMYTFEDKGGRSITLRRRVRLERCAAPSSMDFYARRCR